jgi:hypothetical protein
MISRAWGTFKNYWKFLIPAGIITTLISWGSQFVSRIGERQGSIFIILLGFIVSILVSIIISLGWTQVLMRLVRNGNPDWNDFKTKSTLWGRYILVNILYFLCIIPFFLVFLGSVVLGLSSIPSLTVITVIAVVLAITAIVGLVYVSIRMMFLPFIVVDNQDLQPVALLKKSFALTRGHVGKLIRLGVWQFLVVLLGLIALIIGLVVAIPVIYISTVYMYEHLKSLPQA